MPELDVAIVGAGPVGLLLACLLRAKGLRVLVLERRERPSARSAAIGITPPSLRILGRLGIAEELVAAGVKVRDCHLHGARGRLGTVSFRDIPDEHRFILSIPQADVAARLRRRLGEGNVRDGWEVAALEQLPDRVRLRSAGGGTVEARFAVACDGGRGRMRDLVGIAAPDRSYPCHFAMADYVDRSGLGEDAHLYFTPEGSVESFPLPGGRRRWVVQTDRRLDSVPDGLICRLARDRAGVGPEVGDRLPGASTFTPRRFHCARYHQGRVALCGDAAHGMTPAGGQGMNTGFADAEFLAEVLASGDPLALLPAYTRYRRRAASAAIFRAGWGMRLGTWRGRLASRLRDLILGRVLCAGPVGRRMGAFYAMLTIPHNTLAAVPARALRLPRP